MTKFTDENLILEQFWDRKIPIDVVSIVENLSIPILTDDSINNDSFASFEEEKRTITVKNNISNQKKRFAIAHSLAHHALNHPMPQDILPTYDFGINYFNIQANDFAVNLIIPTEELNKVIGFHTKNKMINIETLSVHFDVSYGAMYYKLKLFGHG